MAEAGTFEKLVAEIGQALLPLREALASPEAFTGFLQRLGWQTDVIPQPLRDLGGGVETLYDSLRRLLGDGGLNIGGSVGDGGASVTISADEVGRVLRAVQDVVNGIRGLASAPDSAFPAPLIADGFKAAFPGQLVDYLVISYLQRHHPSIGFALRSLGVVKTRYVPQTGGRPPHMNLALDLADLPKVLGDPSLVLKNAFGWGEPTFDFAALATQIDNLLMTLGVEIIMAQVPETTVTAVQGTAPDPLAPPVRAVKAVIFERAQASGRMAAEVRLMPLPGQGTEPSGLALLPAYNGVLNFKLELGEGIAVIIRSELDLQGGVALQVRPGKGIEILVGFEPGGGAPAHARGSLEVKTERSDPEGDPILILGAPDRTRLQFRKLSGGGGIRMVGDAADVFAEVELGGLEFVFEPSAADGFIAKVIPEGGFSFGADLTVGVSHRTGFYFRGTSNLDIQLPVHLSLGPVEIQSFTISVSPSGDGLPIGLGTTFKAELGPVKAVVEQIGLSANFAFKPDNDGNLGPLDLSIGFKPPKGAGLSVDAGPVSGGGYLFFDPDKGEYAGALELDFAGIVEVKAIGIISTRMPDGSRGFSLLLVITAEFGTGIQLGFGFTLLAVGGLIGLNRRMDLNALVEGVRSGAIESVMFPRDVIANAPRIISDLRAFFPPQQGTFLIGPMAKIGWGTPTLISLSVGIIIEIPGNIAIIGVLRCILPAKELPLLVLQVNFIGAIEFDKQRVWFFAELFESRVLFMTIEGGMGLLIGWGDDPDLVISVGGFHPAFKPPPLPFPVPRRIMVDILNRPGARIRVSGYFAITSNTAQFGARAELVLGFDDFGLSGHLSFDALFRFSPFSFSIAISASVSLKVFGIGLFSIHLSFQLDGPEPWRARGSGSISLLFFEISADFDITWGESRDTTLPPVDVLPLLAGEISKLEGWETRLPTGGGRPLVSLRQLPETDELVLHPLGTLFIRQRSIPLGIRLDRVGAQRPRDGKRFSLEPAPGSGLVRASITSDKFAMGQFQDMDDAAKLSRPAYEDQDAGVELTAAQGTLASVRVVRRSARYESIIIDSKARQQTLRSTRQGTTRIAPEIQAEPPAKKLTSVSPAVFNQMLEGSSTSRSPLSQREAALRQPYAPSETVQITGQRYVVAYKRNNLQAFPPGTHSATTAGFRSHSAAQDALADWVEDDPALADTLHVLPESETPAPPTTPGTWTATTTAMPSATTTDAAVRLPNGKVIVAGGLDATGVARAETALFDPVANTWSATAALTTARHGHTLTRLADGRVLATGGRTTTAHTATADLYDQLSGTWSGTPEPMDTARSGHSAIQLPNGKVLVAGGIGARGTAGTGALTSAELFDPVTGEWSGTGPMTDARTGHQAVLLTNGRVLVIGGTQPTGRGEAALAYCEIYDPATGKWTPTGSLGTPRSGHQATVLPGGKVLVTGGDLTGVTGKGTYDPGSLATTERYDLATGIWTPVKAMPGGRTRHRSVLLRSGDVLIVGGTTGPAFAAGFRSALLYSPGADTWAVTGGLATGRWATAAVELGDGRVVVAGGRTRSATAAPDPGTGVLTGTAEIFTP